MRTSVLAENKCRNFSSGNKVTLQHAQVPAVVDLAKVAQVKADPVQAVAAREQASKDAQGAVKVALVDAEVSARPTR